MLKLVVEINSKEKSKSTYSPTEVSNLLLERWNFIYCSTDRHIIIYVPRFAAACFVVPCAGYFYSPIKVWLPSFHPARQSVSGAINNFSTLIASSCLPAFLVSKGVFGCMWFHVHSITSKYNPCNLSLTFFCEFSLRGCLTIKCQFVQKGEWESFLFLRRRRRPLNREM